MLEGEYLELCNDLKSKYDTITNKLKRIEAMEIDMKKERPIIKLDKPKQNELTLFLVVQRIFAFPINRMFAWIAK